jgi:tetratricopeptide (TPR) repeat protein
VAFTNLFVALARATGLDAVFVDVTERIIYEADEFYNYQTGHICAGVRNAGGIQLVDFVYYTKQYKRYRVIDDLEAIANYLTLLGVRNDREFIKTGNPDYQKRSINFHTSAIIISPNFTRAMNNLAVIYLRQGNYKLAEELLRRAIKLDEKMITARYNLAELYIRTGKTEKAMELLIENLNQYSREPNTHYRLGQIYFSLGKKDIAEYHLRKAIDIKEDFMAPRLVLLSLLIGNNRFDEAEKLLTETEEKFPSNEKVLAYREMLKKNDLELLQY